MSETESVGSVLNTPYGGIKGKWWLVGGGLTSVVAYIWYKRSQSNTGTSTTGASASTTPDPNAVDPNTGMTYAQEEQYSTDYQGLDYGYGSSGYSDPYGTAGGGYGGSPPEIIYTGGNTTTSPAPKQNDLSWATKTIDDLVKAGYTRAAASAAIGAYLAGIPLTANQEKIVEAGTALNGMPPRAAPKVTVKKGAPTNRRTQHPHRQRHHHSGVTTRGK